MITICSVKDCSISGEPFLIYSFALELYLNVFFCINHKKIYEEKNSVLYFDLKDEKNINDLDKNVCDEIPNLNDEFISPVPNLSDD